MELVRPARTYLDSYIGALEKGWATDSIRGAEAVRQEIAAILADPEAFLASLEDRKGKGPPIKLPDGSFVPRLPGFSRWMWDGEFAGTINLRWQSGTTELPPYCLGHIGYNVVPWRRRKGYATTALRLMLPKAKAVGLPFIEVTTDPQNVGSQRVIEANGGVFVERFIKAPQHGGTIGLRYRIALTANQCAQ